MLFSLCLLSESAAILPFARRKLSDVLLCRNTFTRRSFSTYIQQRPFSFCQYLRQLPKTDRSRLHLERGEQLAPKILHGKLGLSPRPSQRTNFHVGDGLKISEWTLIYHNYNTYWLFTVFTIYSIASIVCIATGLDELAQRRKRLRELNQPETFKNVMNRKAAVYLTFAIAILSTLGRYRRCWVVRIYEKNLSSGGKPPDAIVISSAAPPPKTPPPTRQYCIVWVNFLLRRKLFYYNNGQADRAMEMAPIIVSIVGNFRVQKRSWAVFRHYFNDALDYYRVRGKRVVGGTFVA